MVRTKGGLYRTLLQSSTRISISGETIDALSDRAHSRRRKYRFGWNCLAVSAPQCPHHNVDCAYESRGHSAPCISIPILQYTYQECGFSGAKKDVASAIVILCACSCTDTLPDILKVLTVLSIFAEKGSFLLLFVFACKLAPARCY